MKVEQMTYEYSAAKIEKLFNHELEHIDRLYNLIEPDADSVSRTNWIIKMETCVDEFTAAARTVIEIYIELSNGDCEDWRDLHKLVWELREKLDTRVEHLKEIIDRPF